MSLFLFHRDRTIIAHHIANLMGALRTLLSAATTQKQLFLEVFNECRFQLVSFRNKSDGPFYFRQFSIRWYNFFSDWPIFSISHVTGKNKGLFGHF